MDRQPHKVVPAAAAKKGRKLLVVKKRKKTASKRASGGLPSFAHKASPPATTAAAAWDDDITAEEDTLDSLLADLPNDCALAIQALQQNADTSVAIPVPSSGEYFRGVLELHLHRRLQRQDDSHDTTVSRELADLLHSNTVRTLTSPSRQNHPVTVIVWTADWERAAARRQAQQQQSSDGVVTAVNWLTRRLPYLTARRVTYADLEAQWDRDVVPGRTLDGVLDTLTRHQLLLGSPLEESYQLWLPTWGLVLQAWERGRHRVLQNLKRSFYKERSQTALQQSDSPISTNLLLDWMASVGQVERVERPAGTFVRLPSTEDE